MARNQLKPRRQLGFTLVELLIVVTLTVMLMLTASTLFMTFLIGNTKTSTSRLVKAEGEYALNQIAFLIRNAIEIVQITDMTDPGFPAGILRTCEPNMGTIGLKSIDGNITTLTRSIDPSDNDTKIASNSSYLTSGDLTLTDGPTFDCTRSADGSSYYVTVTFSLRKGTPAIDQARDIVEQQFSTGVQVRSL